VLLSAQVPDLRNSPVPFTHLSFSNEGKELLGVAEGKVFVMDAFTGKSAPIVPWHNACDHAYKHDFCVYDCVFLCVPQPVCVCVTMCVHVLLHCIGSNVCQGRLLL
jgi:hypothetical protein